VTRLVDRRLDKPCEQLGVARRRLAALRVPVMQVLQEDAQERR
jgi:hypothetical protein